jgi:MFS family permease
MAAGLIIASLLTGPWVARQGPRVPMTIGCVLAAAGILITSNILGPHVSLTTLGWILSLAGIGFGIMLVPVTSTPLTVVQPEHSGMAASATNTSREMGAVFGVAVLGSIVNSKLTGQLAARLKELKIPPNFQSLVIHAVTGGGLGGGAAKKAESSKSGLVQDVINAAYQAFGDGLHVALDISGALLLVGAIVSAFTIHGRRAKANVAAQRPL